MATVLVLSDYHGKFPLLVALNRHATPAHSKKPFSVEKLDQDIVGVKTEDVDGTWLGINRQGIFATSTGNEAQSTHQNLLKKMLELSAIKDIIELISKEEVNDKTDTINLVFGDSNGVFVASSHYFGGFFLRKLPQGLTIVKDNFPTLNDGSLTHIHQTLDMSEKNSDWIKYYSFLKSILRDKNISGSSFGYNSIASSILAYDKDGVKRFKFLNKMGKPARFKDHIDLYKEMKKNAG